MAESILELVERDPISVRQPASAIVLGLLGGLNDARCDRLTIRVGPDFDDFEAAIRFFPLGAILHPLDLGRDDAGGIALDRDLSVACAGEP